MCIVAGGISVFSTLVGAGCGFPPPIEQPTKASEVAPFRETLPTTEVDASFTTLPGHAGTIYSLAYSPDGKTLASGSEGRNEAEIKLWDVASGRLKQSLTEETGRVYCVRFHPDGSMFATTNEADAAVRLWDTDKAVDPVRLDAPIGPGEVWGHMSGSFTRPMEAKIKGVAFHPKGTLSATAGPGPAVRIWNIETKALLTTLSAHPGPIMAVAFSPDGKSLAAAGASKNTMSSPGSVKLWETENWTETGSLTGHTSAVLSIAFHPKGSLLITAEYDEGPLRFWDLANQRESRSVPCRTNGLNSLTMSPDGETLAYLDESGRPHLLDVKNPTVGRWLSSGVHQNANTAAFSPDGKTLATGGSTSSNDGAGETIRLWKLKD